MNQIKIKSTILKILRWTERYAKTDMVYLTTGGFWLILGQLLTSATAFLLAIAFANFLPKEIYGQYKYIISVTSILIIFALSGINTTVILATARGFEKVLKNAFQTKIKWSLLGSLGAIILASYFWYQSNVNFAICFLIVAIFLPIGESSLLYFDYLSGKKRFDLRVKYDVITRFIGSLGIVLTIFSTNNLIAIIFVYFLLYTLLKIYFFIHTTKKLPPNDKSDDQFIPYGKQLSFLGILRDIANQIDTILVFNFLGTAQLAIYAFALAPVDQIQSVLKNIRAMAVPKFSASDERIIKKTLLAKITKATLILLIPISLYLLLAPYVYQIFFPQYIDSVPYTRYYAISLILFPLSLIPSYYQAKIKKNKVYFFSIVPPVIRIISMLILAPLYGIYGVISAIIIAEIINCGAAIIFFKFQS